MKTIKFAILAALVSAAGAYAQGGGPPHPGFGRGPGPFGPGPGFGMRPGKLVTGAPYSATVTNTFTETLADGNVISRTTTAQVARDTQGRTYSQETITGGPFGSQSGPKTLIFISDPVAPSSGDTYGGYSYVLDTATKNAYRRPLRTPPTGAGNRTPHTPPANPNVTVTNGAGTYQGLAVDIKTITRTIPAGAIGNANPIQSTDIIQYSTALQIVVASNRSDPRTGQSSYALSNIVQGDPATPITSYLSGYTVQDAPRHEFRGPRPDAVPGPGGPQ